MSKHRNRPWTPATATAVATSAWLDAALLLLLLLAEVTVSAAVLLLSTQVTCVCAASVMASRSSSEAAAAAWDEAPGAAAAVAGGVAPGAGVDPPAGGAEMAAAMLQRVARLQPPLARSCRMWALPVAVPGASSCASSCRTCAFQWTRRRLCLCVTEQNIHTRRVSRGPTKRTHVWVFFFLLMGVMPMLLELAHGGTASTAHPSQRV